MSNSPSVESSPSHGRKMEDGFAVIFTCVSVYFCLDQQTLEFCGIPLQIGPQMALFKHIRSLNYSYSAQKSLLIYWCSTLISFYPFSKLFTHRRPLC